MSVQQGGYTERVEFMLGNWALRFKPAGLSCYLLSYPEFHACVIQAAENNQIMIGLVFDQLKLLLDRIQPAFSRAMTSLLHLDLFFAIKIDAA